MKEIITLLDLYEKSDDMPAALATVINVEGSSYRRTGARMLIYENGIWKGGISGGCLEKDVLKNAKLVMLEGKARTVRYDTNEDSADNIGVGLGCNGVIDILISPLKKGHKRNPLEVLKKCTENRQSNLLITVIKNNSAFELEEGEMFRVSNGDFSSFLDFGLRTESQEMTEKYRLINEKIEKDIDFVLKLNKTQIVDYQIDTKNEFSLLYEILSPNISLIIVGNNYDIYPMSDFARVLGWKISVVANPLKLDKSIFKTAKIYASQNGQIPEIETDEHTAVILMSHDYGTDLRNLKYFLNSSAGYIGILGPRKRGNKLFDDLKKENVVATEAQFNRIFTPTGLDIGANAPEEIAMSILSEIRAFFSSRDGGFLKNRLSRIHE